MNNPYTIKFNYSLSYLFHSKRTHPDKSLSGYVRFFITKRIILILKNELIKQIHFRVINCCILEKEMIYSNSKCLITRCVMSVSYNKLWKLLIDKKMKKKELSQAAGISNSLIAKLGKNENVTVDVLVRICNALECNIDDIVELIPEDKQLVR